MEFLEQISSIKTPQKAQELLFSLIEQWDNRADLCDINQIAQVSEIGQNHKDFIESSEIESDFIQADSMLLDKIEINTIESDIKTYENNNTKNNNKTTIKNENINKIKLAIDFATKAHGDQRRKSGEPYIVHPILVASIVAYFGGDCVMVCAALLHDVVEDTDTSLEQIAELWGKDVASLVDGLTKVSAIRAEELPDSSSNEKLVAAAMTFRKMLLTSIKDVRVLLVKLCDRMHNMLTLDALAPHKQKRISEETLVVYAPIAHRLGISMLKNELESRCFYYIFPQEHRKIEEHLRSQKQAISLKLNSLRQKVKIALQEGGFPESDFRIISRVKRHYSIYLKMQRKGISIDEVLDLLAIRVIVKEPLDCYRALGILHLHFKPIMSRFKDYIALPKENGYQTIHSTLFEQGSIFEVQIRTIAMQHAAEYGIAAHWKYKNSGAGAENAAINLDWLNKLQFQNSGAEEFYELAKNELYRDDIVVFSPDGDNYSLPIGAVALDFAYAVHTEIGDRAREAFVNNQKVSLLTQLKSGDIVKIITAKTPILRASWIDAVKTSRAKSQIRFNCASRIKLIEQKSAINIIATIFNKSAESIESFVKEKALRDQIYKAARDLGYLKELKSNIKEMESAGLIAALKFRMLKLKEQRFDNIILHSNHNISQASFDYCCHPKFGDDIVALKSGNKAFIHHKLCDRAYADIERGCKMFFVEWADSKKASYELIVALENRKGTLAQFLSYLAKYDINVLSVEIGAENSAQNLGYGKHCEVVFECENRSISNLRELLKGFKIIDIYPSKDVYGK